MAVKKSTKKPACAKIKTLGDLTQRCSRGDEVAQRLAIISAENLGGSPRDWQSAMRTLEDNANAIEHETGDDGELSVVDEINFCISML